MKSSFEWQISHPEPDGTVSVVVRFTTEECRERDTALAEKIGAAVIQSLEEAIQEGRLVIPVTP